MTGHTAPEPLTNLTCPERKEKPVSPLDGFPEVVITGGSTGAGTTVRIDGKEIEYLESVRFETTAGQLSRVTMTFIPKSITICTLGEVMAYERELIPSGQRRDNNDGVNRITFHADANERNYKQTLAKYHRLSRLMREVETLMRELDPANTRMNLLETGCQFGGEHEEIQRQHSESAARAGNRQKPLQN